MKHILIFVLLCLTVACTNKTEPYRTALLGSKMTSFDPVGLNEYNEITFFSQICGRLTAVDETLNIEGDLAESWDITEDRKHFTFKIKSGRHFSDGSPVTVDDIKFSLDRVAKANSIASTWANEVHSVEVVSPEKISIKLSHGNPRMLYTLSHPRFCILKKDAPFVDVKGVRVPNSSGAYKVSEASDKEFHLQVSEDFKDKAREKTVVVRFLDQKQAVAEFEQGKLDDLSFYLLEDQEIQKVAGKGKVLKTKLFWTWMLFLNPASPAFKQTEDRQAFINQIDSKVLVAGWKADTKVSHSIIPEGMRGYTEINSRSGNNKRFSCSRPLRVTIIEGIPLQDNLKESITAQLKSSTNCKAQVEILEMGKFMESYQRAGSDIYISGIDTNSTDPLGFYRQFIGGSSENFLKYKNSKLNRIYHRLYDQLPEKRSKNDYEEIQSAFYRAGFGLAIGHPEFKFVYGKEVASVHMNPLGMHLNRWWMVGRR